MIGRNTLFCLMIAWSSSAFGQQVIQQPVLGVTSVNTTVTVPDRGSAYLGGTSSAQSGRTQYGPMRSGTSSGMTRQSTSISTSVYIHDFEAMDQALLNSAEGIAERTRIRNRSTVSRQNRTVLGETEISPTQKASKFEELAQKAEKAGKPTVARLHWEMAAKHGSQLAKQQLENNLTSSRSSTAVASSLQDLQSAPVVGQKQK